MSELHQGASRSVCINSRDISLSELGSIVPGLNCQTVFKCFELTWTVIVNIGKTKGFKMCKLMKLLQNTKTQTVVKLTVVPCAPVVEVKIKRPDTKYQLGFSVQNGVVGVDTVTAFWLLLSCLEFSYV